MRRHRPPVMFGAFLAVAFLGAAPALAALSTETITTLVLSTTTGLETSIILDVQNTVHVAFFDPAAEKVKYASRLNGAVSWTVEDVDAAAVVHSSAVALALDPSRVPHVFYYDVTNGALKRARKPGASWLTDTVEAFVSTRNFVAAAAGSDGVVRAVYSHEPSSTTRYAEFVGTSWSTFTALTFLGRSCDIAVGAADPRMLVVNDDFNLNSRFLSVVDKAGSSFSFTDIGVLGSTDAVIPRVSLALDSAGDAHMSYFVEASTRLVYAELSGTVVSSTSFSTASLTRFGLDSSLALDALERPRIALWEEGVGAHLLSFNGTAWSTTTLHADGTAGPGISLTLNPLGNIFASYMVGSSGDLVFATTANRNLSVSGTVVDGAGVPLPGVTVSLTGSIVPASAVTPGAGTFSFSNLLEGSYALAPSFPGYGFEPASRALVPLTASAASQDFTGGPVGFSQVDNLIDPTQGQSVTLTASVLTGNLFIGVYALNGRLVRTLVDEDKVLGSYSVSWDGRNGDGEVVASGIYLVRVKGAGVKALEKVAVVK